jgi:hypothetical protein
MMQKGTPLQRCSSSLNSIVRRLFMNFAYLKRILVLALISSPAISQEIDRKFTYSADLTGDGRNERIVLAIHGAAIDKPFKWSLTVTDRENHILFKTENDDSRFDKFFGEEGYMDGCSTYEQCKRRYYFEDKPKNVSNCLKGGRTKELAASTAAALGYDNPSEAARYFLEERKTSPTAIEAALKELQSALASTRTNSLCYREYEHDHGKYLVWLKSVGEFVPYFAP